VIARNEARCIQRCLDSFAPWIASMVVLDTGSDDATPELALAAGATVHRFAWCDDFAAARNAALDHCCTPWVLMADADEWLIDGGPWLQHLSPPAATLGLVTMHNSFDESSSQGVISARLPRLLPRGTRYAGRVHEQPVSPLPLRPVPVVLGHDGYEHAQRARKQGRNERLLQTALREAPHDPYLLYQLGKEQVARGDAAAAAQSYRAAADHAPADASYRPNLMVRWLATLQTVRDWPRALAVIEAEMPRHATHGDFMLTAGNAFWNWAEAQPERSTELLPLAEGAWLQSYEAALQRTDDAEQLQHTAQRAALSLEALYRRLERPAEAARFGALAAAAA
jgi:hypothetical protein